MSETVRLTVGQAVIRFLVHQYVESDGEEMRLIAGAFGIFGHGNVAGIGQALLQNELDPDEPEADWLPEASYADEEVDEFGRKSAGSTVGLDRIVHG